jgi:hypothetical protein
MANFTVHIMRPYQTVDMDGGDVALDKNTYVAVQLSTEWENNIR